MLRTLPLERVRDLGSAESGLSAGEAAGRRARYGLNEIVETRDRGWRDLARETLRDPMLWFLAAAGLLFFLLGERREGLTLAVAIVPLVGMDAWLHRRTHASTRGLASLLATRARVVRDGIEMEVPSLEVVPGEIALVVAGEPFPADGILVGGEGLHAEESALTGEALPVPKERVDVTGAPGPETRIDSRHWGLAGTRLLTGRARLRVVFTGAETFYGEIVRSAAEGVRARTPLQAAIARLVAVLLILAGATCLLLASVRLLQGYGLADALLSALSLAVAALPEEFPVVLAVFLGVGVHRLARRRALVRRAVAVENIGRVTCLCCDKTGTLTEGRLQVVGDRPVAGTSSERLRSLAAIASAPEGGDPLNEAVAAAAPRSGREENVRLATFPFTENRRRETAVVRGLARTLIAAVKGAPEEILPATTLPAEARTEWTRVAEELAGEGTKVIAVASQVVEETSWGGREPEDGFAFAGLLLLEDRLRPGVAETVRTVQEAGVRVILVTGDHPASGLAVARRIGLGSGTPAVMLGDDLEGRLMREGATAASGLDVVARALPRHKLHLVRALQEGGEVVAVTGDGVNDVPALQAADVGIAMGEHGTRSAREAAAIVLLDENFRTISSSIAEGRQLFRNLQRSFAYLIAVHIPFVASAALIPLLGLPLLYQPIHVVWIELLIHPTAFLVFQAPTEEGQASRPPRGRRARIFGRWGWIAIASTGTALAFLVAGGYARSLGAARDVEHARAMALATMGVGSAALAGALSGLATRTSRFVVLATLVLGALLLQTPILAAQLHVSPLHADDWIIALAGGTLAAIPVLVWNARSSRAAARGADSGRAAAEAVPR